MGGTLSRQKQQDPDVGNDLKQEVNLARNRFDNDNLLQAQVVNDSDGSSSSSSLKLTNRELNLSYNGDCLKSRGKKRKRRIFVDYNDDSNIKTFSEKEYDQPDKELKKVMITPKRLKMVTTTRYIYEQLFERGKESDVSVFALGKEWKLHKVYLCQSLYFSSMFSRGWKESQLKEVKMEVPDPEINADALNVALGALYQDEIVVEPTQVVPILAAACFLQIEGLKDQCSVTMISTINSRTVIKYSLAAKVYGVWEVERKCHEWLHINLLSHLPEQPDLIREIPPQLMEDIISSSKLFVMQTEFSVYVLLRLWLFLKYHTKWQGRPQEAVMESHNFFQSRAKTSAEYFLDSVEGLPFKKVFKSLRLQHLINHHLDMEMLLTDRIIPEKWMYEIYRNQWQTLLRIDQDIDRGLNNLSEEIFCSFCNRCGRTLNFPGHNQQMWRWTGFNMGLDLIVTYDKFSLSIKRNQSSSSGTDHEALLDTHKKRNLLYRISIACLNEQKQVIHFESTGVQLLTLTRNSSQTVMNMKPESVKFPLYLSFNFMVSNPKLI